MSSILRAAPLALLLLTAGCFRPAGESIMPTPGVLLPDNVGEPAIDAPSLEALPTLEADESMVIPLVEPLAESDGVPAEPVPDAAGAEMGVQPNLLGEQAQAQPTPMPTLVPATSTPQFITPGVPLGPITPDPTEPILNATSTPSGLITPTSLPGTSGDDCLYIVQAGDNLFRIATSRGFTVEDMRRANPNLVGDPPVLQIGQLLNLPECQPAGVPSAPLGAQTAPDEVPAGQPLLAPATAPPEFMAGEIYTVRPGDTLFTISQRFGVSIQAIVDANNLTNPDRLSIGQTLIIPAR
ncbi:MAG: LysM peptidoglycan-binding domain-containing protein [Aggregatilineales bacterium]